MEEREYAGSPATYTWSVDTSKANSKKDDLTESPVGHPTVWGAEGPTSPGATNAGLQPY